MESIDFTFHFLYLKTSFERLSRGVAVVAGGFWMKFEAQLVQPC
jgi:hypothetical protein